MSDKKYPYIGEGKRAGNIIVLFTSNSTGEVVAAGNSVTDSYCEGYASDAWSEDSFKNITREYLSNTYGKCESQEHADFICKLAERHGFNYINDYNEKAQWFSFGCTVVDFYKESTAKSDGEKLIHLPLPPKENEMEETKQAKPIYTKEMHERGELPPVGSEVQLSFGKGVVKLDEDKCGFLCILVNGEYYLTNKESIKPIPTIEDELSNEIANYITQPKSIDCSELADLLLTKYNITPKDQN